VIYHYGTSYFLYPAERRRERILSHCMRVNHAVHSEIPSLKVTSWYNIFIHSDYILLLMRAESTTFSTYLLFHGRMPQLPKFEHVKFFLLNICFLNMLNSSYFQK
jgi:hypothetical protein